MGTYGFSVHYADGVYEISRGGQGESHKLYYDLDGSIHTFLCVMEEQQLTLPSPQPDDDR